MFLPESEPNSSVVHPEAYSILYYPQSGKCEYAFILNKCAEYSQLWEANVRSSTQEILRLVEYPKVPYRIQDTALLWARWIQSISSRLPSLRHKRVRKIVSYFSYLIKKIRKNYTQRRVEEGKDSQRQALDIQFTILVRWTASISYCSFYLFNLRSILYIYLRVYLFLVHLMTILIAHI
jgi:myosin heavy subunit